MVFFLIADVFGRDLITAPRCGPNQASHMFALAWCMGGCIQKVAPQMVEQASRYIFFRGDAGAQ